MHRLARPIPGLCLKGEANWARNFRVREAPKLGAERRRKNSLQTAQLTTPQPSSPPWRPGD